MKTSVHITPTLPARAHSERIALAIVDILRADPVIRSREWCGDVDDPENNPARVYRVPEATLWPNRRRPMITVAPDFKSLPLRLQGEADVALRIMITAFFDEPRVVLEDTDRGIDSILHHLWRTLTATTEARHLKVDRYGHEPLVIRPPQTADLTLAEVVQTLEDGSRMLSREAQLQLTYAYTLDRQTGQPQGFTDAD